MQDLTSEQFDSLKTLSKNPLINQISIDMHSNSLLRVTVISVIGAEFNSVDALLEEVFPGKEYRGSVGEGEHEDYYSIDVEGETLIGLMMKKSPVEKKWTLEEVLEREVKHGALQPYLCQIP